MDSRVWIFVLLAVFAHTVPAAGTPLVFDDPQPPATTPQIAAVATTAPEDTAQAVPGQSGTGSTIKVEPGGEVIKPKDLYDATGYFHPFVRMPKYFLQDQRAIWTSPFHTARRDIKWWVIFGGATGALIALDKHYSRNAPDSPTLTSAGKDVSYLGVSYTLLPMAAGFYLGGTAYRSDHFREAGLLSFESLADVSVMELVIKSIADRQRPLEGHGNGQFEASTSPRYNSSFPSGHALATFAMASVFAHEYPDKLWVKILVYSYAAGVVGARVAANMHFPGDVLAGGALGWFTGDYVYAKRHNSELDKKPIARKILEHVKIGLAYQ